MLMTIHKIGKGLHAGLELRKLTVNLLPQQLPAQNPRMGTYREAGDRLPRKDVPGKRAGEIEVQPAGKRSIRQRPRGLRPGRRQNHRACRRYHALGGKLQDRGNRRTRPSRSRRR